MDPFRRWFQLSGFTWVRGSDRFWRKVAIDPDPAACWTWLNGRNSTGYGVFRWHGQVVLAHRLAWELSHGTPIPEGMLVRHRCDHQLCCRPSHLLLGWHADNMADMAERGRGRTGVLSGEQVAAIRASGEKAAVLAGVFGVTATAVSKIRRGEVYGSASCGSASCGDGGSVGDRPQQQRVGV